MAGPQLSQQQTMQQTLAPQLRQALEYLQVPMLELRTLIQQELEQNPTLEELPMDMEPLEIEPGSPEPDERMEDLDVEEQIEALANLDQDWGDYYRKNHTLQPHSTEEDERRRFFMDSLSEGETLEEHLKNQLALSSLENEDRRAAELIIGSLNDDGYLTVSLEEISEVSSLDISRFEYALQQIQDLHPIGVAARNLEECLHNQLERLGLKDSLAADIVHNCLNDLAAHKYDGIAKALHTSREEVQKAVGIIESLDPRPGRIYSNETAAFVVPDVVVTKTDEGYKIIMNDEYIPQLRISRYYKELLKDPAASREARSYVKDKIRGGAFLIKSIEQRQSTLYNVARLIVDIQEDFLEHGVSALKPLTMNSIAERLEVHETTVSRAIANKFMQTPQGLFDMKYFFTPGIKAADGGMVSNKSVKDMIEQILLEEDEQKPYSDQTIVKLLKDRRITIARRTVAKYREELKILPSHMRKRA